MVVGKKLMPRARLVLCVALAVSLVLFGVHLLPVELSGAGLGIGAASTTMTMTTTTTTETTTRWRDPLEDEQKRLCSKCERYLAAVPDSAGKFGLYFWQFHRALILAEKYGLKFLYHHFQPNYAIDYEGWDDLLGFFGTYTTYDSVCSDGLNFESGVCYSILSCMHPVLIPLSERETIESKLKAAVANNTECNTIFHLEKNQGFMSDETFSPMLKEMYWKARKTDNEVLEFSDDVFSIAVLPDHENIQKETVAQSVKGFQTVVASLVSHLGKAGIDASCVEVHVFSVHPVGELDPLRSVGATAKIHPIVDATMLNSIRNLMAADVFVGGYSEISHYVSMVSNGLTLRTFHDFELDGSWKNQRDLRLADDLAALPRRRLNLPCAVSSRA